MSRSEISGPTVDRWEAVPAVCDGFASLPSWVIAASSEILAIRRRIVCRVLRGRAAIAQKGGLLVSNDCIIDRFGWFSDRLDHSTRSTVSTFPSANQVSPAIDQFGWLNRWLEHFNRAIAQRREVRTCEKSTIVPLEWSHELMRHSTRSIVGRKGR